MQAFGNVYGSFDQMAVGTGALAQPASQMSVFNSNVPNQSNPILNLDWSGYARGGDIEKASGRVSGSLDKAAQQITKAVADVGKDSKKMVDAIQKSSERVVDTVKASSEKISDTVKRTAVNNTNAEQTTPPVSGATVFQESLQCIATATARVAEHVRIHPEEASAALQSAKSIAKQFTDLTDRATQCSEENQRLREAAAEVKRASGWIGGNLCGAGGGNNQCIPVGNAAFNALWERYGG